MPRSVAPASGALDHFRECNAPQKSCCALFEGDLHQVKPEGGEAWSVGALIAGGASLTLYKGQATSYNRGYITYGQDKSVLFIASSAAVFNEGLLFSGWGFLAQQNLQSLPLEFVLKIEASTVADYAVLLSRLPGWEIDEYDISETIKRLKCDEET